MKRKKVFRTIKLLSSGAVVQIDPNQWLQISGAKEFDATQTKILRVFKPRAEERYLVHGVRSADWDKKAKAYKTLVEAYELVAINDALPDAIAKVAAHCGVAVLVTKMVDRGER